MLNRARTGVICRIYLGDGIGVRLAEMARRGLRIRSPGHGMMLDDFGSHVTICTSRRREVYAQRSRYLVT